MGYEDNIEGLIFDIQRYAIHDGTGIRTLIFMQGCPLRCLWCQNPEGQIKAKQLMYFPEKCIKCGRCVSNCPGGALSLHKAGLNINREACTVCIKCQKECCSQALKIVGEKVTVAEVMKVIFRDTLFYKHTGGGVTISGGEPLMQPQFVIELLKECKKNYIHTAIETCGFGNWADLEKMLKYLDQIFFDIKIMDPVKHEKITGVDNRLILDNLEKLSKYKKHLVIRVPVIPGYNDSECEMEAIAKFVQQKVNNVQTIELMPYHSLGESKYSALGIDYRLKGLKSLNEEDIKPLKKIIETYGFKTK